MSRLHDLAAAALRTLDPEDAHRLTVRALALGLGPGAPVPDPILATTIAGLSLPSALGLAAGFDKNAEVFGPMLAAGFGFVECGTVTPLAQAGNPRPRLFRLTGDRAVINRMGFNNAGLEAFAARLARPGRPGPVGANIGANKDSDDRIGDYVTGLKRLWGLADWFTLNISSPNTPGLRALQTRAALEELLGRTAEARDALPAGGRVPLFLKVAPDLDDPEIEAIVETVLAFGLSGIIVANTTLSRPALASPDAGEAGGLSDENDRQAGRSTHRGVDGDENQAPLGHMCGVQERVDADAEDRCDDQRQHPDEEGDGKIVDRHAGRHHRRHRPQQPGGDGQPRAWGPQLPASHVDRSSSR